MEKIKKKAFIHFNKTPSPRCSSIVETRSGPTPLKL